MKHDLKTVPVNAGTFKVKYETFCEVCGQHWKLKAPDSECPGVKLYTLSPWPKGMITARQAAAKRLKVGPLAGVIRYRKANGGLLKLYREDECTPKPPLTEKQQATIIKMQAGALAARTCQKCGSVESRRDIRGGYCPVCLYYAEREYDRDVQVAWAREKLAAGFLVLDSETTGLSGEIIQLAVIDHAGETLINTYIKPTEAIDEQPDPRGNRTAFEVNGISNAMVSDAPSFVEVYPRLAELLTGRNVIIYNAAFDVARLENACRCAHLPMIEADWDCAMLAYAAYVGDWSHYHKSYRWQPLNGGHDALGDCLATLEVIKEMANHE